MVKVTLNENLVPSRHPRVKDSPHTDLVYNLLLARKLIKIAQHIFQFKGGAAVYSGYICQVPKGVIAIKVFERGVLIRSVTLNASFDGELAVDVASYSLATGQDVFEGLIPGSRLDLVFDFPDAE
jgi:hypothetical protein